MPVTDWQIHLSDAEKTAVTLGSMEMKGWSCPAGCFADESNFSGEVGFPLHLRAYILSTTSKTFDTCPDCGGLTIVRNETLLDEINSEGNKQKRISRKCYCCDYVEEYVVYVEPSPTPTGGDGSGGNSFGGGFSDGGGASGGW